MGLILDRRPTRIVSGHTGAMPGFVAALSLDRASRTVVAALSNVTRGVRPGALATGILEGVADSLEPAAPAQVMDLPACPEDLVGVLGRWWCEAEETVFTWQDGVLQAYLSDSPLTSRTVFSHHGNDSYQASSGRQQGERLVRHPRRAGPGQPTGVGDLPLYAHAALTPFAQSVGDAIQSLCR